MNESMNRKPRNDVEILEQFVDDHCTYPYINLLDIFLKGLHIYPVWENQGSNPNDTTKWDYVCTLEAYANSPYNGREIFTTYEGAERQYNEKVNNSKMYYRTKRSLLGTVLSSKHINKLVNSKGNFVIIVDPLELDVNRISFRYKIQNESVESSKDIKFKSLEDNEVIENNFDISYLVDLIIKEGKNIIQAENIANMIFEYDDIKEICKNYINNNKYDNSLIVEGYTAKRLKSEFGDDINWYEVFLYLVDLRNHPEETKKLLEDIL